MSGIIAGILFLIALCQKNFLLAVFVILAEFTVIIWAKRLPKTIEFKIDEKGIHCGQLRFYPYEDLAGFHIKKENKEAGDLILKTKSKINPVIKINIFLKDLNNIKNVLKNYLDEVEYEESFIDSITDKLGF